jgi:hypothetical protein
MKEGKKKKAAKTFALARLFGTGPPISPGLSTTY